jgi:methyl-accepting chemotaxis protein
MKNIKIGVKLTSAFLFIAFLAVFIGIYLLHKMSIMDDKNDTLYERGIIPLGLLVKTAEQAILQDVFLRDFKLAKTAEERNAAVKNFDDARNVLKDVLGKQSEAALTSDLKSHIKNLQSAVDEYTNEFHKFVKLASKECPPPGECLIPLPSTFQKAGDERNKWGNEAIGTGISETDKVSKDISTLFHRSYNLSVIVLILVTLVSITFGIYLTFSITNPLKAVVSELSKIESGDMTTRLNLNRKDELGTLSGELNKLAESMQKIMKSLRLSSDTIAGASEELSSISKSMASGAEETVTQSTTIAGTTEQMSLNINAMASAAEQASVGANEVAGAAEEMSTNMSTIETAIEEMSASIKQIADNTSGVRKVAEDATAKSKNATNAMNKLGIAAKEIGQVTDVIKKIADKTNLLALNATIEAASAGEAGKGFAVVAGEIKELANQSAKSADDIAHRIDSIQHETNDAVTVIEDVSNIIGQINESVESIAGHVDQQTKVSNEIANNVAQANLGSKRVASAIAEVAKGGNEVSRNASDAARGAQDVSSNVSSMSQVAKDSASGAGQVSQSAKDLSKISSDLNKTVSRFKV